MPDTLHPCTDPLLAERVLDDTRQWLERAVIGLNLCPFAKSVVVKKQLRYALTLAGDPDQLLAEIENELALLAASDPQALDTTLLIHPQVLTDFLDYYFFLGEVDALIDRLGYAGVFQIASLHPQYEFAGSDPDEIACAAFGVMKLKNMYGKPVRGIERSTFVLGEGGSVLREWRGVKVPSHVAEVLAFVNTL